MGSNKEKKQIYDWSKQAALHNYPATDPLTVSCMCMVFLLIVSLLFLGGCGGGPMKYQTLESIPPVKEPDPNKELQQQLMVQAARASRADYRDYKVGPEDLLLVEVYGQDELKRELRVNGQGQITMPLVGVVKVGGLTTKEIEKRLMELYGSQYLRNPQVTVEVKEFHHQRVAVTGAVAEPGFYEIIGPRSLLEVLAIAGGIINEPNRIQAGDVIHVIRHQNAAEVAETGSTGSTHSFSPRTQTLVINLRRLVSGEAPDLNVTVHAGDVVHVPFAGNAYVLGGVKKPGNVAVRQNLTLTQAVAMAGGVDPLVGTYKITVMRFDEQGRPVSIETNLKNIAARTDPDLRVEDNDVILVNVGEVKRALWMIRQILPIPSGGYSIPTN